MWRQALSNQVQHIDKNHLGNAGKENGSMALSLKCKPSVRGNQAGLVQKQRESSSVFWKESGSGRGWRGGAESSGAFRVT